MIILHLFLAAYKVEPGFNAGKVEAAGGWIAAYPEYFRAAYPSIYRLNAPE